jgi:ABC-type lipoprotein export system ATPase subunit
VGRIRKGRAEAEPSVRSDAAPPLNRTADNPGDLLTRRRSRKRFGWGLIIPPDESGDFDDDLDDDDLDSDDPDTDDLNTDDLHTEDPGNRDVARRESDSLTDNDGRKEMLSGPVLPEGVRTVAWDYASLLLPKERLSAVIFEDRLLILPIHEAYLDPAYNTTTPHSTVWEFLSERGREASVAPISVRSAEPIKAVQAIIDLTEPIRSPLSTPSSTAPTRPDRSPSVGVGPVVEREGADVATASLLAPDVEESYLLPDTSDTDVDLAQTEEFALLARGGDVFLARPMRSGAIAGAPAVELSDVSVTDENGATLLTGVDFSIAVGELVVILGARKRTARALMGVVSSLVQPTTGLVLHDGVPVRLSLEDERFRLVRPGVLPRRSDFAADRSAVDHVAFPMLVFGVEPTRARRHAAAVIRELGAESLVSQPVQFLTAIERHVLAVARAIAGPWPSLYLHDPLSDVPEETARRMRSAILRRSHAGRTIVVLSDDPWLLTEATRVIGVNAATVFEAVHRGGR